ncbi:MAG: hypothetical protein WCR08_08425 [Gammaproteobacteria bacterium]
MFVLDSDKSFFVMPVCYHPTTVLAVDDERQFLDALKLKVSDHLSLMCFDNPEEALEYIKSSRELQVPFAARLHYSGKHDTKECGFARMLDSAVQDIIHPYPKGLSQPKEQSAYYLSENSPEIRDTVRDFKHSQYILTEVSFYYYNHSNELEWVTSDPVMLKQLNNAFQQEIDNLSSVQLANIIDITNHRRPEKLGFSFRGIRQEPYNRNRFGEIILVSTDYDMPGKNGIEFIKAATFSGITLEHITIILTGKISDEFKQKLNTLSLPTEYIGKNDPERIQKLLKMVEEKTSRIFQECSYKALTILSQDSKEDACFTYDKEFGKIFTSYIKENNICEMYLFDRQGSYLFLDENANLSWFIIRSEKGMENSIQKSIEHGAPKQVIDVLKTKQFVLSLYEDDDFSIFRGKVIDWSKYIHPASVFESRINNQKVLEIKTDDNDSSNKPKKFYYAFIKGFPEIDIDKGKILSYKEFLRQASQSQIK